MGKKVYFLDSVEQSDGSYNNVYGVDDVNAIVSNLVGAGIAPFPSGDTYDVSELNSLTSALVAEGTSLDGLKVSFADNKIHIAQGIGYFENGATIVVDADGEGLDYSVAETLYVYAEYNQALNTCVFQTSESEPSDDIGIYTLMLATIAADGSVEDKRTFAQSKVASLGKNESRNYVIVDHSGTEDYSSWEPGGTGGFGERIIWEKSIDISKFNLLLINGKMYPDSETTDSRYRITNYIKRLNGGEPFDHRIFWLNWTTVRWYALAMRYKDGKLQIYVPASTEKVELNFMNLHTLTVELF